MVSPNSFMHHFLTSTCEWLRGSGPESDIVLSSRIRLARNLTGFSFTDRLSVPQQQNLISEVEDAFKQTAHLKDAQFMDYKALKELDKQFLLERHLISRLSYQKMK